MTFRETIAIIKARHRVTKLPCKTCNDPLLCKDYAGFPKSDLDKECSEPWPGCSTCGHTAREHDPLFGKVA